MQVMKKRGPFMWALLMAMVFALIPQSEAAFNTNITALITDANTFFTDSIIPWIVLVAGVVIVSGLVMKFRKGPAR